MLGGKGALITAVVLGALTSFMVWKYVAEVGQTSRPADAEPVVVAAAPIPARAVITSDMLRVQQIPAAGRHPAALRSPNEVVGKIARISLTPGEQVLSTKLYLQREESGLAFFVPEGMRAVSVGFTEVIGSGGLVLPGDHVDVIGVFEVKGPLLTAVLQSNGAQVNMQNDNKPNGQTDNESTFVATTVLQDLEVLAIAQRVEGEDTRDSMARVTQGDGASATAASNNGASQVRSQPPAQPQAKTATLAVGPDDALRLTLAEERGRIRLALRRSKDDSVAKVAVLPFPELVRPASR
jgi:pilus assembly protein CpaB